MAQNLLKFTASKLEKARQSAKRRKESEEEEAGTWGILREDKQVRMVKCTEDSDEILHDFTSFAMDKKIWDMAKELEDFELLSRISGGDLVAIEAQYHIGCLTKFRNSYRSLKKKEDKMEAAWMRWWMNLGHLFSLQHTVLTKENCCLNFRNCTLCMKHA